MHATQRYRAIRLDDEEDRLGKALEVGSANIFPDQRSAFRLSCDPMHHGLQATGELRTQARTLRFVPALRFLKLVCAALSRKTMSSKVRASAMS